MARYITQQRKELLSFLRRNLDRQFSAREISERLKHAGISLSAVYRNLAALEETGVICRCVREGSREIFYQYIDAAACKESLHLTCTACGHTLHMNFSLTEEMLRQVAALDQFDISPQKTILYGLCGQCRCPQTATKGTKTSAI